MKSDHGMVYRAIGNALYAALERIGICAAERTKQNVNFHSWRHFFNSVCLTRIPVYMLQRFTGHRMRAMTEFYIHLPNLERVNQAVSRSKSRFPDDFAFQLNLRQMREWMSRL